MGPDVLALLMVFGMPVMIVLIVSHYRFKTKELEKAPKGPDPRLLEAAGKERKLLEARIENLESIVTSVDFELNQRLNKLAHEKLLAPVNPTDRTQPASTPPGGTLGASIEPGYAMGLLRPGQVVLGRYTIERELGRGGMGAVYLANDSKLSERVALKTISSALAGDPAEMADRFRMEVQAARKVTHPNVIRIHDIGEDGPLLFLSMEYVEGETLFARVKRLGALAVPEARAILGDVAAGVAAAHAAGVVHRDLKPHNVLLGKGRAVKVIDFGLAKMSFATGMTATGLIMGTPEYMAPEQVRGLATDARTDVYALGAMAYFALAGKPPFVGTTPIAIGFAQVNDAPPPLRTQRPEVPLALEEAVMRALAKEPGKRFPDAGEMKRALGD
ncbi:MAG TPA: serine/threonine-protein kinase [Haliangiales bacterium]|nr:serine/threonine-protein kinase [Haliangiales bacterium]